LNISLLCKIFAKTRSSAGTKKTEEEAIFKQQKMASSSPFIV
jgi:hypothetical protein